MLGRLNATDDIGADPELPRPFLRQGLLGDRLDDVRCYSKKRS
jgi:hypothetical protein